MYGSKKGNAIAEVFVLMLAVFIFILYAVFANDFMGEFNTAWQADSDVSNISKTTMNTSATTYPTTMDYGAVMIFMLMWIGSIISAFLIDTHPIFFPIAMILALVLIMVPAHMANMYEEVVTDETLDAEATFPYTSFIMQHLVEYYIVVVFSIMLVLYGKTR